MRRLKIAAVAAAALPLVVGGVIVATAAPAAAGPSACSTGLDDAEARGWTICSAGSGYYRVRIICKASPSAAGNLSAYGEWEYVGSGRASVRTCSPTFPYIIGASTQTA